ncbi:uroporphyrinogen-III C-methyltransferase [Flavihumibacter profundi]|jgi:uroporphyrin-III C-methyltransferase|uniref:uroporphyrinogen-III C-methyltransferase n=1 Tax=Flavihumibacter profundi TaxID=2716883 RepID=UPI001CC5C2B6|nr:uroporphyrinogen-III C-methyltransferase [Flavihumibacter profundi]MBZ5856310.1 uroporphyrinogen-III C-methyltransferase [Flavihumibacter profundi]
MKAVHQNNGKVYITGAGPGDINLVTLRAKAVIEQADVILYDNLVNPEMLEWAPSHAKRIFVGKLPYCSVITQETINEWMVEHALQSMQVVRLKGGDPMIFGRGAEEAAYLKQHGIEFEIIPGVTSSLAAGAYAGIPLTHRDASQMVLFVTGHTKRGSKTGLNFDWPMLGAFEGTIVFYMGVKHIDQIADQLIKAGKQKETLVAVIENGTLLHQRVISANLASIAEEVKVASIGTPALIIVGDVVRYHQELNWFEVIQKQFKQKTA